MNPKPFVELNHFTVPILRSAIGSTSCFKLGYASGSNFLSDDDPKLDKNYCNLNSNIAIINVIVNIKLKVTGK